MEEYKRSEVVYKYYLPDNEEEERTHRNGPKFKRVIEDLLEGLRKEYKYGDDTPIAPSDFKERVIDLLREHEALDEIY